jgi:hypothetical protein
LAFYLVESASCLIIDPARPGILLLKLLQQQPILLCEPGQKLLVIVALPNVVADFVVHI